MENHGKGGKREERDMTKSRVRREKLKRNFLSVTPCPINRWVICTYQTVVSSLWAWGTTWHISLVPYLQSKISPILVNNHNGVFNHQTLCKDGMRIFIIFRSSISIINSSDTSQLFLVKMDGLDAKCHTILTEDPDPFPGPWELSNSSFVLSSLKMLFFMKN